jgi:hypothetical protein
MFSLSHRDSKRLRGKRFEKLWRDSRDGFSAVEFHRDGHIKCIVVGETSLV